MLGIILQLCSEHGEPRACGVHALAKCCCSRYLLVRCVLELQAIAEKKEKGSGLFAMAMTAKEQQRFLLGAQTCISPYLEMLGRINAECSTCSRDEDRKNIFEGIRSSVGFAKLSRMVFTILEGWMEEQLRGQALASACAGDAEGEMHWSLLLSLFFRAQGKLDQAIEINKVVLDSAKDKQSAMAQSALLSIATIYGEFGRHDDALKLKEDLLKSSGSINHRFQGAQI
jgi:tetratricopeptide (TPR) repeat protein